LAGLVPAIHAFPLRDINGLGDVDARIKSGHGLLLAQRTGNGVMPDRVQFELVTPERLLISEAVEMVVVPGTEGNFGVLPGHALLISTIRPGTIEVYEGQRVTRRIFVAGGFAEVTPERCTVLADEAAPAGDLNRTAIEAELQVVQGNLPSLREQVSRSTGAERERLLIEQHGLERAQAVAQAKLQVLAEAAH
jgi:F-type H+-transporting ATPase subunit epsilon